MTDTARQTVLKRKTAAGRPHGGDAPRSPARLFGQAVAKSAQDMLNLPIAVIEAVELRASLAELPERMSERALLAVMDGPDEALGLVALSSETLASLIEVQTTGRIGAAEVPARRPTRTDAAMSVRFVDRIMAELEVTLASDAAITWAGGYRYASFLDDPRPLGLMLEDIAYRVLHLTLGFGAGGARRGTIMLAVPAEGRGRMPDAPDRAVSDPGAAAVAAEWGERIEAAVNGAEVRIEAVLDRVSLPLAAVLALRPGAMVPVSKAALSRVKIEGKGHRFVAWGRLGQSRGHLAVRVHLSLQEDGE
ncbi:FliM/FliN family flagellar motor C-terminal domain-containing protein [Defluviimonas sp. SAOS-178_SWC]|uniref:FliM/FliN family flagellar motor C-terminal domain-containing protein n=1 Tax=Defluviimonas sp. SAOS-178_SWC TaxID=3121287 RepID=UPI00322207B7